MLSSGRSGLIRQKLGVKEQINEKLRRYERLERCFSSGKILSAVATTKKKIKLKIIVGLS